MKRINILLSGFLLLIFTSCDFYHSEVPLGKSEDAVIDSSLIGFWQVFSGFMEFTSGSVQVCNQIEEDLEFISILPFNKNYYIVDFLFYSDTAANLLNFFLQDGSWEQLSRKSNDYNSNGDLTKCLTQAWNESKYSYLNENLVLNGYDSLGNHISHLEQSWNEQLSLWQNLSQTRSDYDNSKLKEYSSKKWNDNTKQWEKKKRQIHLYDSTGSKTEYIIQRGDSETNKWGNNWRHLFTYDDHGNAIEKSNFKWDKENKIWQSTGLRLTSFDADTNITEDISKLWDTDKSIWINKGKRNYSFDSQGNEIKNYVYKWNKDILEWENEEYRTNSYDEAGNKTELLIQKINRSTGEWKNVTRNLFKYDTNGNQIIIRRQKWDSATEQWKDIRSFQTTYNDIGLKTEYINGQGKKEQYSYDTRGNQKMKISYNKNEAGENWINSDKETYSYDSEGNQTSKISFYWNPIGKKWIKSRQDSYSYDQNRNLTEETSEGSVFANYPEFMRLSAFSSRINSTDYYNMKDIIAPLTDPGEDKFFFLKIEKLGQDTIQVLYLENELSEFNSSKKFRNYVQSNFDSFNKSFISLFYLKRLNIF